MRQASRNLLAINCGKEIMSYKYISNSSLKGKGSKSNGSDAPNLCLIHTIGLHPNFARIRKSF